MQTNLKNLVGLNDAAGAHTMLTASAHCFVHTAYICTKVPTPITINLHQGTDPYHKQSINSGKGQMHQQSGDILEICMIIARPTYNNNKYSIYIAQNIK